MSPESGPERHGMADAVRRADDTTGRAPDGIGREPDMTGSAADEFERDRANPASGPRILPLRGARGANAPAFVELPPPDGVEALYYEGMAAYQHRHWEEALERFSRLKELQPTRPGLDALLDEVRWFLQLQAAAPVGPPLHSNREKKARSRKGWRLGSKTTIYVILALLVVAGALLTAFRNGLPWRENPAAEELYHRGQARLAVGDYEGAQAAFAKMLEMSPGDREALAGLEHAQRQQTLAQNYNSAQAAMTEEDWERASAELDAILEIDPAYRDARQLADRVSKLRRLADLYADGGRFYDMGKWSKALEQFEKIQALDPSYRAEAISEFLFVCYLNEGQALLTVEGGRTAEVEQAVTYFRQALVIHPRNRSAADAERLGSLYLAALQALADGDREAAHAALSTIVAEAPAYADGQAARRLYNVMVELGNDALAGGNVVKAVEQFSVAQTLPVNDLTAAQEGLALARAATPTASPTPANTPTETAVPTPWAVARAGIIARTGPETTYALAGEVASGATLTIIARREDGAWLKVCCTTDGREAWVPLQLLDVQGPIDQAEVIKLPSATAAPSRAPTATPEPVNTATPEPPDTATPPPNVCLEGSALNVAGAQPLVGWTVTLVDAQGTRQAVQTNGAGFYRFAAVAAGPATVSVEVPPGWRSVSPTTAGAMIEPSAVCAVVDFWSEEAPSEPVAAPPSPVAPPPAPTPLR